MQTRNPLNISPPIIPEYLWFVEEGKAALKGPSADAAIPGQAFREDGQGGITVAVGEEITDDDIWREDGIGGIELNT